MATVFLLNINPTSDKLHWRNICSLLERAFNLSKGHTTIDSPEKADLILVCGSPQNPMFPHELIFNETISRYRGKCVRFCNDMFVLPLIQGFYTSIKNRDINKFRIGGFYPHVAERKPYSPYSLDKDFPYLFSFLGDFTTHIVRKKISQLAHPRSYIVHTGKHPGNLPGQPKEVYEDFKNRYVKSIADSKFILCPRGMSPSSIRLFEVMKAQRVPVVISDDWARLPGIPWEDFCIFVREKDVYNIPEILNLYEPEFKNRAKLARQIWERFFSSDQTANTIVDLSLIILKEAGQPTLWKTLCYRYFFNYSFWRYGVVGEMRRLFLN